MLHVAGEDRPDLDREPPIAAKSASTDGVAWQHGAAVRLRVQPRDLMLFDAQGRALAA